MKKLLNYIPVLGVAMAFAACESDLDGATYNAETAQAAVLSTPATTSYVLESRNSANVAFTLEWTKPDLGYNAIVTTTIDFDVAGNNFANAVQLASVTTATSQDILVGNLNNSILTLLRNQGIEEDLSARDFEIRLSSSISTAVSPLRSNVITLNITPYSSDIQYPEVYVIGDYNSWADGDSQQSLFSFSEDGVNFEGVIDFGSAAANGFKIRGAIDNWDNGNWGLDGSAAVPDAEAASITLINDGSSGNITCYSHRFYHFSFNNSTLVLTMNKSFDQLGVCGDLTGWADDADIVMEFDAATQRFYADVEIPSDGGLKFRADGDWSKAYNLGGADGVLVDNGDNIAVTAGNYRIYVNLNNSGNMTYELNADDYQGE